MSRPDIEQPRCGADFGPEFEPCSMEPGHYDKSGLPHYARARQDPNRSVEFVPLLGHTDDAPKWATVWDSHSLRLHEGTVRPLPMSLLFTGYSRYEGEKAVTHQIADERPDAHGQIDTGRSMFSGLSDIERAALRALCTKALRILDADALEASRG